MTNPILTIEVYSDNRGKLSAHVTGDASRAEIEPVLWALACRRLRMGKFDLEVEASNDDHALIDDVVSGSIGLDA